MNQPKYQYIAMIAGFFTILSFSHLAYRVYLTKDTKHLTFIWIFLVLTAQSLLFLYGILNKSYGIYIPAMFLLLGLSYILYVKLNKFIDNKMDTQIQIKNTI